MLRYLFTSFLIISVVFSVFTALIFHGYTNHVDINPSLIWFSIAVGTGFGLIGSLISLVFKYLLKLQTVNGQIPENISLKLIVALIFVPVILVLAVIDAYNK